MGWKGEARGNVDTMNFSGQRVLVMGLGLHGGGLESAVYLARHGAELTVTDLRDEKKLAPSIEKLEAAVPGPARIRYVLGKHDMADFERADLVIKNPGVRPDSPYLRAAGHVETDISLFLARSPARLIAVTGTKGKSSTSSALRQVLDLARQPVPGAGTPGILPGKAWLGGNIAVSPLSFLDRLEGGDDVVLELSSWQLGDLRGRLKDDGSPLLKPRCAVITAIMPDHLDWYDSMSAYVADKRVIYGGQDREDATIAGGDSWGRSFLAETPGRPLCYGDGGPAEALPARLLVPGPHQRQNLLAAALALLDLGLPAELIREGLGAFRGIPYRLEFFHEWRGARFYDDSAATIHEAAAAAVAAFEGTGRVLLLAGGSDKGLDLEPLIRAAEQAGELFLLAGTATEKLIGPLGERGIPFRGPFQSMETAVRALLEQARPADIALLSPGCASFGMFLNEFDRGDQWKETVKRLA
ncbi:MAG: UDP-N-acetylmuramoyl-L-alanine--D-glutamate ligase [Treponema sp.]|nr:UDP-N-acetylmuramoyl-L-alanine--D-glutamate ligase [Treponema sp.]